jgi:hypothetical protein
LKRSLGLLTFLNLVGLIGCSHNNTYVKKGEIQKTITQQAENSRYIEALGIGAADSTLTNSTQRKATSRDAAIVQAQYEMLSYVKGVQLEGGVTVEKAMETDSKIESYLKEVIKGADIIKTEWTNDDGCVVTLRLDKKKIEGAGLKLKS